jgi:hypothetical protein
MNYTWKSENSAMELIKNVTHEVKKLNENTWSTHLAHPILVLIKIIYHLTEDTLFTSLKNQQSYSDSITDIRH